MLVVMAGLPGVGKSALAEDLGRALPAPVLSVDPIEAAMWRAGIDRSQPTGLAAYVVVEAVAGELLGLGQTVVVDSVNDAERAREQWGLLAHGRDVPVRFIEVVCSDRELHRLRLAQRNRFIEGFYEPTWASVEARRAGLDSWDGERLVLDSARSRDENLTTALGYLANTSAR